MNKPPNSSARRHFVGSCTASALTLLTACKGGKAADEMPCDAQPATPVTRKFVFDRTTVPPASVAPKLVRHLEQGLDRGEHLQVLRCGGITASLVEEFARFQAPSALLDPGLRERERWSKSPNQIRRERWCAEQALKAMNLRSRLNELVADIDQAPQARSPLFEAISAAVAGWRGTTLEFWSDGLEHMGAQRSFYGLGRALQLPDPGLWIERLKADGLLPNLKGVRVMHLAIGLSEVVTGQPRVLRAHDQTLALKRVWAAYWDATGATHRFAEPLPWQD